MIGRPRKATSLKALQGTLRKHREPVNPVPLLDGVPEPPLSLSLRAAAIFHDLQALLVATRVHSAADAMLLVLLAQRLEEIEVCSASIEELGRVVRRKGSHGSVIETTNPAIQQRSDAMRHAHQLLNDCGLSPASRAKVLAAKPRANRENPFSEFMDI